MPPEEYRYKFERQIEDRQHGVQYLGNISPWKIVTGARPTVERTWKWVWKPHMIVECIRTFPGLCNFINTLPKLCISKKGF